LIRKREGPPDVAFPARADLALVALGFAGVFDAVIVLLCLDFLRDKMSMELAEYASFFTKMQLFQEGNVS
jgi:hypothetical protein